MANIKIAVINHYKKIKKSDLEKTVEALQIQVHRDFAPAWGIDADIEIFKSKTDVPANYWQLVILTNSDEADAFGYHDMTKSGQPMGKVFAGTDEQSGSPWSITASHELLEMLGDPDINLTVFREEKHGGVLYSYENCDACEEDKFAYKINGIPVSDFVFPEWFEDFHRGGTQYDFCKKISKPFQLLDGGYIGVYNVNAGSGWTQLNPPAAKLSYKMRARVGSRRERRRTPRSQWMHSV